MWPSMFLKVKLPIMKNLHLYYVSITFIRSDWKDILKIAAFLKSDFLQPSMTSKVRSYIRWTDGRTEIFFWDVEELKFTIRFNYVKILGYTILNNVHTILILV